MGYDDDGKRDQVFWHIAPKQAEHVAELIHKGIGFYLQGDLGQWFWTTTALREIINYDLDKDERGLLDDMEKSTQAKMVYWEKYSRLREEGRRVPLEIKQEKSEFLKRVKNYQRKVFDFLKELGYFPDKEDRTKLGF
jgi:hypothetical protein